MRRYTSEIERKISHYPSYNLIYLNEVYTNPTTTPTKDHVKNIINAYKNEYKEWEESNSEAYIESIAVRKVAEGLFKEIKEEGVYRGIADRTQRIGNRATVTSILRHIREKMWEEVGRIDQDTEQETNKVAKRVRRKNELSKIYSRSVIGG